MKLDMTYEQYEKMYKRASRDSSSIQNCVKAFMIGGGICVIGQGFSELYGALGLSEKAAGAGVSLSLIALSVILTALGIYSRIAKHGGAGTLIPITGFANAVASPAIEFKTEGMITGLGVKIFSIAGPVILYGSLAGVIIGAVYYIIK